MEIKVKGDVQKEEQKDCRYGQKVPLEGGAQADQQAPSQDGHHRGGRLKKAIVKKEG